MNLSSHVTDSYNLTGQVTLTKYMPDFRGNYSVVFRGTVKGVLVAVKVIEATGQPTSVRRKVLRERTVWASLSHPNILPYYGFADDTTFGPFPAPYGALISPWCDNGDAGRYLSEHGEEMTIAERVEIWRGVVDAVAYLHHRIPMIVHGDLKPGNVLIDDEGRPKICDFGLAHIFFDEPGSGMTTTTEHTGTERYLAPELVMGDSDVNPTAASDVYALGCLGLEFIYLQRPYSHRKNNIRGIIFTDMKRGVPPATRPPSQSARAWKLLELCWNRDPNNRPSAVQTAGTAASIVLTLPPTIIRIIVAFTAEIENKLDSDSYLRDWSQRTHLLRNLCLVSKACQAAAMPHLYGDIRILGSENQDEIISYLLSTLYATAVDRTGRKWSCGSYTKSLVYILKSELIVAFNLPFHELTTIMALIRQFPMLKYMTVKGTVDGDEIHTPYEPTISRVPLETPFLVSSVKIVGVGTHVVLQLLAAFQELPLLQSLSIILLDIETIRREHPPSVAGFPNLCDLRISGNGESLAFLLRSFSPCDIPQLTSFHLNVPKGGREYLLALSTFLHMYGGTLRHFTSDVQAAPLLSLQEVLLLCPNLQTLSIPAPGIYLHSALYRHSKLSSLNLLYSTEAYGRPFEFGNDPLKKFWLDMPQWYPKLAEVVILARNFDGSLTWAASIDALYGVARVDSETIGSKHSPTGSVLSRKKPKIRLLDIDSFELARQLTIMESEIFLSIQEAEWAVSPKYLPDNITAAFQMNNRIAHWVADTILSKDDPKDRATVIKYFISVAERCRYLQNYASMAAIITGLNSPPIERLEDTWKQVHIRNNVVLRDLGKTLDTANNFEGYKILQSSLRPPSVPFIIAPYLTEIHGAVYVSDGLWGSRRMAAIKEMTRFQTEAYNLTPLAAILTFIRENITPNDTSPTVLRLGLGHEITVREGQTPRTPPPEYSY